MGIPIEPRDETCWLDGKFTNMRLFDETKNEYVSVLKKCDGLCIKTTEKCNGKCEGNQCESAEGLCHYSADHNSKWQNCKGKCISKEDLCDGKCTDSYRCELKGKCLSR